MSGQDATKYIPQPIPLFFNIIHIVIDKKYLTGSFDQLIVIEDIIFIF